MEVLSCRVDEALLLAMELHREQVRKASDTPYVAHLWSVAALVAEQGGTEDEVIAGFLHDAAEDQGGEATLARIREQFGERVSQIVSGCSDTFETPKPPWRVRKETHLAHYEDAEIGVLRVSLADKLHNARSLLMELRQHGPGAFAHFQGGKVGTLWYFSALADVFDRRMPGRWSDELRRTVSLIREMVGGST